MYLLLTYSGTICNFYKPTVVLYVSTTNLQWYSMYLLQTYSGTLCIYYKPTVVLYAFTTNLQWYYMYLLQTYSGTLCIYYKPTMVLYVSTTNLQWYSINDTSTRGVGGYAPVLEFCIYILWNFEHVWATPLYRIKTSNIFDTFDRWLQATFSSAFSLKKNALFWCRFHEIYPKRSNDEKSALVQVMGCRR